MSTAGAVVAGGATAALGVALALTIGNHSVTATTARSITASGAITLTASGVSAQAASATASASGAPENGASSGTGAGGGAAGSGVDQEVAVQRANADSVATANGGAGSGTAVSPSASTSDGKVNVAAAIGIDLATVTSSATIIGTGLVLTSGGLVTLASSANTDATSAADGSASHGATATIGAAVAITLANVRNTAILPAGNQVHAKSLTVSATVTPNGPDTVSAYGAQATSGAGGGKISVAGSLGLAVINQSTLAELAGNVTLTGGDLIVTAASNAVSTVKAEPTAGGVTATNVGVGASVALNLITDTTTATLDDGVAVTGAGNMTLTAVAKDLANTEAKMGAAGGKVDIAPAVAVTISNVTTTARVGTLAAPITLSGAFAGNASQVASASSTAGAVVAGGTTAAIGVGLALTIGNHTVTATTARSITAGTTISLTTSGVSGQSSSASASASGAPENGATTSGAGGGAAGSGVDDQVTGQRTNADSVATANGGRGSGTTATPSASTSDGKVNVAAAIGITIATTTFQATIEGTGLVLTAGGLVELASSANSDATSAADGSASHGTTATIGAAVAITLANVKNTAILPADNEVHANGLTVSATVTPNGTDAVSTYGADATSGAGQGKISVAGSLGLAIVNQSTRAEIAGAVELTGGDVTVTAASNAVSTVQAEPTPGGVSATNVGVGASVALNLITDTTTAVLNDDITVTGARNFTMTSTAGDIATTEARMGASGGKVAVTPAVAIAISNVTTSTSIGTRALGGLVLDGSYSAIASQTAGASTTAGSIATGGATASIGIALALNLVTHTVTSTTGRNITAAGGIGFGAFGSSKDAAIATASASGAPDNTSAPAGGVDGQAQAQRDNAITTDTQNGGSGSAASPNPSASTSDGKVTVAAAVAINIADVTAVSTLPDGLTLTAGGMVSLRSSQNVDGTVTADGTAVKSTNASIGVGVALNLVNIINRSYLGQNTTVTSNGFDEQATMTNVAGDTTHTFVVEADSGAGSDKIGVAGALALNLITDFTEAYIPGSAVVSAGTGDISFVAQNLRSDSAKAKSDASIGGGGTVGVGASIAINVLTDNVTRAEVEDGATLTGGRNVTLSVTSAEPVVNVVTAGSAGSTAAVSPAVGINIVVNTTVARLGTPGAGTLAATGAVLIAATHTGSASITGDAKAVGDKVAVGAIIAVNVLTVTTTAATDRNVSAGSVVLAATTTTSGSADVTASAQGALLGTAGNADSQSNDAVKNTPSTTGNESMLPSGDSSASGAVSNSNSPTGASNTQSGKSSGQGVGVGAAVSVNVVTDTTTASIADNLTVTATGAVEVNATNATSATAKAQGTSLKKNSTNIGAAVGLNVATVTNIGSIGTGATVSGGSIAVRAVMPAGAHNDFVVWGISAAGGSGGVSIAGSVGVQVISYESTAVIGVGSTVTSTGGLVMTASNPMGLQNVTASGGLSLDKSGVGAAIVINVLTVDTLAYVDSNASRPTTVDAGGAMAISAIASVSPVAMPSILGIKLPSLTSVAIAGGAGTSGVAVGGSFIVDVLNLTTQAYIAHHAEVNRRTAAGGGQSISLIAQGDLTVFELAGAVALGTGSAGVGISLIVGVINKDVRAYVGNSVLTAAGGDVTIRATGSQDFTEIAIGAAATTGSSVSGSIVVLVIDQGDGAPGTRAYIDGGRGQATTVHAGGNLTIAAAENASNISLYAGNIAIGTGTAGIGVASDVLVRGGTVDAYIAGYDDVWSKGTAGLVIGALQNEKITLVAVAGAGGGTAGVAGSATVDLLTNATHAHIDSGAVINGNNLGAALTQGVALSASDTTTITGIAGQVAVGGTASVGTGADVEVIDKDTQAWIAPLVAVTVNGNATVDAISTEDVTSISAGGSFAGTAAVTVNAAVSVFTIATKAFVGEICSAGTVNAASCAGSRTTINAGGNARISANEQLTLTMVAGSLAVGGTVGVGAAAAVPIITKTTTSFIGDNSIVNALGKNGSSLTVDTGGFTVTLVDTRFTPATALEGDGHTLNLGYVHGFSEGQQVLYDDGGGQPIGGLTQGAAYYVHIVSDHEVQLSLTPGGAVIGLTAPLRGGESQRLMASDKATAPVSTAPYFTPAGDVVGNTVDLPYDLTLSGGGALTTGTPVVYSSGGGAPIGGLVDGGTYYAIVTGAHSIQLADTACHANPGGSNCPSGSVQQALSLNGAAATGRAHSIVLQGAQPSGDAAAITGDRTVTTATASGFIGVAVTANNSDDISGIGVSAAIGGTVGVGVGGSVNVVTSNTNAFIGKIAQVNSTNGGANSAQSVLVAAGNAFSQLMVSAAAGGGTVGVGASVTVGVVTLTTNAVIDDSARVNAARDVAVVAQASDSVTAVAATAAGGFVGVAGAVAVIVLDTQTHAKTGLGVTINAGNNVLVLAADATSIIVVSGGVAGGFVGVGIGVGVTSVTKDTEAFIGAGSSVNAMATQPLSGLTGVYAGTIVGLGFPTLGTFTGLAVQAGSSENVFGLAVAVGAGFVGVAGGVNVTLLHVTTLAAIDSDALNRTAVNLAPGAGSLQSVSVAAADSMKTLTIGGGVGGGAVGVAGGIDIGIADASVNAYIGTNATVYAANSVSISALSARQIQTYALSIGGGVVGVAGSVSVWTVGTQPTGTYNEGAYGTDKGVWVSGAGYVKGDVVTGSDGKWYGARVDAPSLNPVLDTSQSQWEAATDSLTTGNGIPAGRGWRVCERIRCGWVPGYSHRCTKRLVR